MSAHGSHYANDREVTNNKKIKTLILSPLCLSINIFVPSRPLSDLSSPLILTPLPHPSSSPLIPTPYPHPLSLLWPEHSRSLVTPDDPKRVSSSPVPPRLTLEGRYWLRRKITCERWYGTSRRRQVSNINHNYRLYARNDELHSLSPSVSILSIFTPDRPYLQYTYTNPNLIYTNTNSQINPQC